MGNTILQSQQTYPERRSEGYVIKENECRTNCKVAKVCKKSKNIKILLDKGAKDMCSRVKVMKSLIMSLGMLLLKFI